MSINKAYNTNMPFSIKTLAAHAIAPCEVRPDGTLTSPRSFGVFELPPASGTRRFRLGNYPIRMHELEREYGSCKLLYLFLQRPDALAMASELNKHELYSESSNDERTTTELGRDGTRMGKSLW